ncbi:MAG: rhomboid family intramembrane serine protease [Pirellulales bacterium]
MRLAGTLTDLGQARRFGGYLDTLGIANRIDGNGQTWEIWVRDDDQLPRATEELRQYQAEPHAPQYQVAPTKPAAPPKPSRSREHRYLGSTPLPYDRIWVTSFVIALCVVIMGTMPLEPKTPQQQELLHSRQNLLLYEPVDIPRITIDEKELEAMDPRDAAKLIREATDLESLNRPFSKIREGQVWRLFTPCLMHGGIMHLLMNMMALYSLGSLIELRRGPFFLAALILVIGVVSNTAQYAIGLFHGDAVLAGNFLGFSGVDFGLAGYVYVRSRFARLDPLWMFLMSDRQALYFLAWGVLCLLGLFGPIANTAHFVGLAMGAMIAWIGVKRREATGR